MRPLAFAKISLARNAKGEKVSGREYSLPTALIDRAAAGEPFNIPTERFLFFFARTPQ